MRIVIAGAGLAGYRVAEELRSGGFGGQILLIGAEKRPPYDRPPLSKKFLTEPGLDPSLRADFGALDVEFRAGETAVELSPAAATVGTDHDKYRYDALVIATGASPIALPGTGRQLFLRSYEDAVTLRSLMRPGLRLAIIGAGWIGAELATAASGKGCSVTVVEAGPAPLATALGEVGGLTAPWYAAAGVALRTGEMVSSVEDGGLALASGDWLAADVIVTAVGVRPNVGWLSGSGLALSNGVEVNGSLRASLARGRAASGGAAGGGGAVGGGAAPDIYAVGDCAAFESARFGQRMRVEHWDVALHAPEVAAANILGASATYDPVPYFWSEQFGRMVQYAGYHADADQLVWRGSPQDPRWGACWLREGKLVAVLAVDRPRDLLQGRRLIEQAPAVNPDLLADPETPLKSAAFLAPARPRQARARNGHGAATRAAGVFGRGSHVAHWRGDRD
jgi:3-phenylpropionate/trans-cinnamate dioxygenase ferredoxin reductase subunit